MTIIEQLASLADRVAALEARATIETGGLATAESVTSVCDRVEALEAAVGAAEQSQ